MTVTQKKSRTRKSSKSSKSRSQETSKAPVDSSQSANDKDSFEALPIRNSELYTIMDLQAYYLLAADLLRKVDVDHADDESITQIIARLWEEWKECYPNDSLPEQAGRSLITRLNLIRALKCIYNINSLRSDKSNSFRKKTANAAKDLLDLLSDKFAEGKFMNSSMCINILVELKSLFVYYELASGVEEGNSFRDYRKAEGNAFIDSEFQIATLSHIPSALEPKVAELLLKAEDRILSNFEAGNYELEEIVDFPDLEEKMRSFFVRIFNDVNAYSLPELHPDFEEISDTVTKSTREEFEEGVPLSNTQVASILTAMKKIQDSASIVDLRALDDLIDGEYWDNTHGKKPRSATPTGKNQSQKGGVWTEEETKTLEKGMELFGNDWKTIKEHFSGTLHKRTNVNLKDRARNVKRKRIKEGLPLGIWHLACG